MIETCNVYLNVHMLMMESARHQLVKTFEFVGNKAEVQ